MTPVDAPRAPATNFRFKRVMVWDGNARIYRLGRFMWERGKPGFGGYSVKLSFAFSSRAFGWRKEKHGRGWTATVLGLRVHKSNSYGGTFV